MRIFKVVLLLLLFSRLQAQNTFPASGNVGIGTSSPVYKLSVYGANVDESSISLQSGVDSRFLIQEGNNTLRIGGTTSGIGIINVLNTGKVGIGNTAPGEKFSVQDTEGTLTAGPHAVSSFIRSAGGTARGVVLGYYADGANETGAVVRTANGGDLFLQPSAGNVGIGTAITGTYKLAVEGTIGARRIKVTQTSWADFVFDPAYRLPSLQEVENYITVIKHLPDVPSAAEIAKDGQDLGEMNKVLLQKVEEQTLYLIELKKENEKQQVMIDQLTQIVKQLQIASTSN